MTLQELIPLGTNGFFPSHGRQTASFLVLGCTSNGARGALLLDAGSGIGRLVEPALSYKLSQVERLDVILTHYHLDHVCGLPALPAALTATAGSPSKDQSSAQPPEQHDPPKLVVWAPAPPLVDSHPRHALDRLLGPPLFPQGLDAFLSHAALEQYSQASHLEQIPLFGKATSQPLVLRRQHHPGGSVGLRFGHQLAYITDTKADEATAEFVAGVDLLLHEVWVSGEQAKRDQGLVQGHTDATSAKQLAEHAEVRRFMPVHHHPTRNKEALRALHRELEGGSFELLDAVEGQSYQLGPKPK